jgi:hypothetical protein
MCRFAALRSTEHRMTSHDDYDHVAPYGQYISSGRIAGLMHAWRLCSDRSMALIGQAMQDLPSLDRTNDSRPCYVLDCTDVLSRQLEVFGASRLQRPVPARVFVALPPAALRSNAAVPAVDRWAEKRGVAWLHCTRAGLSWSPVGAQVLAGKG